MPHRPAIASMSLGRAAVHKLPNKLDQAARYGFEGIELFFEDLESFAREQSGLETLATQDYINAAYAIRRLCDDRHLEIICLQPFMHYEGLRDRQHQKERLEEMKLWIDLAHILGTDTIQIPSNFLTKEELTGNFDDMVSDLKEVADMGLQASPTVRYAYESLCWGTYVDLWEECWRVVEAVDRPNFGICLDTFNIAGRVYADPAASSGKTSTAEADIKASIARLASTVDAKKVFFVQVVDAERLNQPLLEGHEFFVEGQPSRMSWSRNCRLFYGEQSRGGYLPVREIADAFLNGIGFEGFWSMELFNRCMAYEDPSMPEQLASRGIASWSKLTKDLHIPTTSSTEAANKQPAWRPGQETSSSARL